ncbi:hypothetical protein UFOVP518_15 [uncultured Caudovirales phage]|uniref:Uncharacterized protein n=1 Tax=uncultured Caudovirales phage TaxID=2100421 RepID=A0A6J5MJ18_9CAUD|nr:hypothetical protein UFOVP518_15 [uncultured Caudovirales phage]
MPPQTQILIADKIKAWAFPSLLSIISIFLYHFYQQQNELVEKMNESIITQTKQSGQNTLIIYRIDQLDKQINNLTEKK